MYSVDLDALALEYQRDYGTATGDLDISDVLNNPFAHCIFSVFDLSLSKELSDLLGIEIRVLCNDAPDSSLVTKHTF